MASLAIQQFQTIVYEYYHQHGRHDLLWRQAEADDTFDPYKILVSELMLQQTQVSRVTPKYEAFLACFPCVSDLAKAPLGEVLRIWVGLGYNRRARYLHQAAEQLMANNHGQLPLSQHELMELPGVGFNTAGAIAAYAYNAPVVFVETNIRSVFIHHFFQDGTEIADTEITELVREALDRDNSRLWYWALMDYGSFLKRSIGNVSQASKSYTRQSKFQGSRRQIRGQVIRALQTQSLDQEQLLTLVPDERLQGILADLTHEGLIQDSEGVFRL
jgi:A/G-specific adenine glycosylase